MKIVVFGANGGVGKDFVEQAVAAGRDVVGVIRETVAPAPVTTNPQFITGSITDAAFVAEVTKGCDAVVSTVGTLQYKQPVSLYSEGAEALIEGMRMSGVKRLMVLSAGAATTESNDPLLFRYIFKPLLWDRLRYLYDDMLRMERLLEASDLDWTIVRLSYLKTNPLTGHYRTMTEGAVRYGFSINKADVAHYLEAHLNDKESYRHHVCIAN